MLPSGIDKYLGSWSSASGNRLTVVRRTLRTAKVSLMGQDGHPILRPYMNLAPTVDLFARYDDIEGFLDVDLWERNSGFVLSLLHESEYHTNGTWCDFIVFALCRNESDSHLSAYYSIFGKLDCYTRKPNKTPEPTA